MQRSEGQLEVSAHLRRAEPLPRGVDDVAGQAQPRRYVQRIAAPWDTLRQAHRVGLNMGNARHCKRHMVDLAVQLRPMN